MGVIGDLATQSPWWYPLRRQYALGIVLGVVGLIVRIATVPLSPAATWFSALVEVLAVVVLLWTGYTARRRGLRPSWQAAGVGLLYGVVSGAGAVLNPTTYSEELHFLLARAQTLKSSVLKMTRAQMVHDARLYTTPSAHVEAFVGSLLYGVVFGLLLGWVGSLFFSGRAAPTPDA
jgi:hypothetical protein